VKTLSDCVDNYMQGQPDRSKHSFDALAAALSAHIANRPETVFSLGYANAATNNNMALEVAEADQQGAHGTTLSGRDPTAG
jgi:hypothetical protein